MDNPTHPRPPAVAPNGPSRARRTSPRTARHLRAHRPRAPAPGRPPHGPLGQPPARPPVPPPSEEALELAARRMRTLVAFGLATLVTLLLPLPWQLGSGAFAVAAVVAGVRAVSAATRARRSSAVIASAVGTTMISALVTLWFVAALVLWPIPLELQQCQSQALTISAQHACQVQYQQAVTDRLGGQFPGLLLTPTPSP